MASNTITIPFKLDGIDYAITGTDTLNKNVSTLKNNISTVSTGGGFKIVSSDVDNANSKVSNFGSNLTRTTKESGKAIHAMSEGLSFFGSQSESVDKVSKAILILSELMKAQELLTEATVNAGNKGFLGQLKAIGQLIIGKKAAQTATQGLAAAQTAEAATAEGAAVATTGLGAAIKAMLVPAALILIAVGALVGLYEVFKAKGEEATHIVDAQVKSFNQLDEAAQKITQTFYALEKIKNQAGLSTLEKQLDLNKAQNGTAEDQLALNKKIIEQKQKILETSISELNSNILNAKLAKDDLLPALAHYLAKQKELTIGSDEYKANEEKINDLVKQRKDKIDLINKAVIEQKDLQSQLNISKQFDGKILQANYNYEKKIANEKERQYLFEQKTNLEKAKTAALNNASATNKLNVDSQVQDLKFAADKILSVIDPDAIKQKQDLLIKALNLEQQQSLDEFLKTEREKSDATIKTYELEIDNIDKKIKNEHLSASTIKQLRKDQKEYEKLIIDEIYAYQKKVDDKTLANKKETTQKTVDILITTTQGAAQAQLEELTTKINEAEEKLTHDIEGHSNGRIFIFGREKKALINAYKTGVDQIIRDMEARRDAIVNALRAAGTPEEVVQQFVEEANKGISNLRNVALKGGKDIGKGLSDGFKQALAAAKQLNDEAINLYQSIVDFQNTKLEEQAKIYEQEIDMLEEQANRKKQIVDETNSRINSIENQLQNSRGNRQKYLLGLLNTELRHKKEAQKEEQAILKKKTESEKKLEEIRKEQARKQLQLDKARTISSGALAAIEAYAALAGLGPAGPFLGAAAAALIVAATAIQVANIQEQIDSFGAQGGLLLGPSHANGGIKGKGRFGNIEVEGNEFIVRKEAVKNNLSAIATINSNPNTKFNVVPAARSTSRMIGAAGGVLPNFEAMQNAIAIGSKSNDNSISEAIKEGMENADISVSVVDINNGQKRVKVIDQLAKV